MHKRMLYCRNKMEKVRKILPKKAHDRIEPIWNSILASQSNDVFWHGLFGGVYYRFLRQTTHKNILHAESLLDLLKEEVGEPFPIVKIKDVLLDGQPDGILENKDVNCCFSCHDDEDLYEEGCEIYDKKYRYRGTVCCAVYDAIRRYKDHLNKDER